MTGADVEAVAWRPGPLLSCELVGLDWPSKIWRLRAGPPRRLPFGGCAEALVTEETPPGGFPMRHAVTALAPDSHTSWVEMYEFSYTRNKDDAAEAQHHLWILLVIRATKGEVVLQGVRDGSDKPAKIDPALLRGSRPDYDNNSLQAAGLTFHSVSVWPSAEWRQPPPAFDAVRVSGDSLAPGRNTITDDEAADPNASYSPEALAAWYLLRVHTWPSNQPGPTEAGDHAAALKHFGSIVTRGEIRRIRRDKARPEWRKPGPRGRR